MFFVLIVFFFVLDLIIKIILALEISIGVVGRTDSDNSASRVVVMKIDDDLPTVAS